MEKKKENKTKNNSIKKKTNTKKKTTIKKKTSSIKKKKGFTLIELLAVIIILGILMIIAIPSVTSYISNSRKESYIDTAKEIVSGTSTIVNEGKLGMYDTGTTYYIPSSYIKTENALKSPYGEFTEAYVGVTFDGKGYSYYWISADDAGQGVKEITSIDKLDADDIKSDIDSNDIRDIIEKTGIDGKTNILILDENGNWEDPREADYNVGSDGEQIPIVIYPENKDKTTVAVGDIVKIKNEEFFVTKNDTTNGNLTLITRYNLNVGPNKKEDEPEGIQSENVIGINNKGKEKYGQLEFSTTAYWDGQVGDGLKYPGNYCTTASVSNCAYVYDSNSLLYPYVNNYKSYLERQGAKVKEARLMTAEEFIDFKNTRLFDAVYSASFWLGTPGPSNSIWMAWSIPNSTGTRTYGLSAFPNPDCYGVRPVIVI